MQPFGGEPDIVFCQRHAGSATSAKRWVRKSD